MMNFVHGIRMEQNGSGTTRNGAEKTTQNGAKETSPKGAKEAMQRCGTVRLPDYRPLPADSGTNTQ
ncbi:hypothetical protein [Alistipes sp.]|uniref:hypothetical protein n=1 Tax=Alistipes sp. TaxID=1872444 RepID=UPI003077F27D